jgi:hypothetical protein
MTAVEAKNLFLLGAVAVGVYFVWKGVNKIPQALSTATDAFAASIAHLWTSVWDPAGVGGTLGNVLFPDGSYVPTAQLPMKSGNDPNGNWGLFTQYQGHIYQLQPSDINGDFPASQVN